MLVVDFIFLLLEIAFFSVIAILSSSKSHATCPNAMLTVVVHGSVPCKFSINYPSRVSDVHT